MQDTTEPALATLVGDSIALIRSHQHPSGAYPACPHYPAYQYSWLRDGAFIADAMSRAGQRDSATAFFGWCAGVLAARSGRIAELTALSRRGEPVAAEQMLPTRYTLDGGDGDEPWWDFQLDGYGTWVWALHAHLSRHRLSADGYRGAVSSTIDYLVAFGDQPCYDWWEEHAEHRHVSTLAAVAAGLGSAEKLSAADGSPLLDAGRRSAAGETAAAIKRLILDRGVHDGHLTKWLGNTAVDGSLLACFTPFAVVDPDGPLAVGTYDRIHRELLRGGVYRYLRDTFYGGGEWLILAAWLGWHEARRGQYEDALRRLRWIAEQATQEGHLPEQVSTHAQQPEYIAEWTRRWGPVATPLLWSHAMFITLAVELAPQWPALAPGQWSASHMAPRR